MSDFLNNLGKIGMVMQAGGGSLAGRDGMAVVREYQQQQEDARKREAIKGLLANSGIGGLQRGLLEQLPVEQQPSAILNFLQQQEAARRAGGAAAAADARARQEAAAYQDYLKTVMGGGAAPQQSAYNTGVAADFIAPSAPLSFGMPAPEAAPGVSARPSAPMSFGEVVQQPPQQDAYTGARATYERLLRMPPPPPGTPMRKAYDDALEFYGRQVEFFAPPDPLEPTADMRNLEFRAREAGLTPGTPEYAQFMLTGGRQDGLVIESDGQGGFRMAQGAAAASGAKPFTEAQSKDNVFVTRAQGALDVLEPVADNLTDRWSRLAEMDPTGFAREMQSSDFQVAQQAGEEFLQAILRKDTGAAITDTEQFLYGRTFLPRPGDGPEVLQAKKAARARAIAAIRAGMSPAQILATEKALGDVAVPDAPPEQGPVQGEQRTDKPASAKFADMTLGQLLENVPTTEEEAAEWNRRYEALQ